MRSHASDYGASVEVTEAGFEAVFFASPSSASPANHPPSDLSFHCVVSADNRASRSATITESRRKIR